MGEYKITPFEITKQYDSYCLTEVLDPSSKQGLRDLIENSKIAEDIKNEMLSNLF